MAVMTDEERAETAQDAPGLIDFIRETRREKWDLVLPRHVLLERVYYQEALKVIAGGRAVPDAASYARDIIQAGCDKCDGHPPAGFTCNECGASGQGG